MMLETSYSRKTMAENCWEAFYHRYKEGLPDKGSASGEIGKATHLALFNLVSDMLKDKKVIKSTARVVKKYAEEACRVELTPIIQPKGVLDKVSPMVRFGLLGFDPTDYDVVIPEMEFDIVIDQAGHRLRGKIDLFLVRKDGVVVVVDYKTGTPYEAEGDVQLATYAIAARAKGYSADRIQCCLKFLGEKQIKIVSFSDDYLDYVLKQYQDHCDEVDQRLASGWDAFPALPSGYCEWCAFKGVCSKNVPLTYLPNDYKDMSLAEMRELMEWVLVMEPLVSEAKTLIKQMTEDKGGFAEVNGEYFGMIPGISREINAEELIKLFGGNGIFDMSVFKVDMQKLERYYRKNSLWEQIENLIEESVRRIFGHKPYLPDGAKTISEIKDNAA